MRSCAVTVILCAAPLVACGRDRGPDTTTWHGVVAPGGWVKIRNVNGSVRVARANGAEAVIVATRSYHGRRPEPVRMVTEQHGGDVVACAAWEGATDCADRPHRGVGLLRRLLHGYGSTDLSFVVALPAGTRLDASTVNGRVTIADLAGEVVAHSVNGSITLGARGGSVQAKTVNGSIAAQVDALAPGARVALETVNGSVTAMLPAALDASVDASTTNGRVATDFAGLPLDRNAHALHGTLGHGSNAVSLKSVNGAVRIEQIR
jgi:Putative adhesin